MEKGAPLKAAAGREALEESSLLGQGGQIWMTKRPCESRNNVV